MILLVKTELLRLWGEFMDNEKLLDSVILNWTDGTQERLYQIFSWKRNDNNFMIYDAVSEIIKKRENLQFPKTEALLEKYEQIVQIVSDNYEKYDDLSDYDKSLFCHLMLHLAEALFDEWQEGAIDLAKYICVMANINKIGVDIEVK